MTTLDMITRQRSMLLATYGISFALWQLSELELARAMASPPWRDIAIPVCILAWIASAILLFWQSRRHRTLVEGDERTRAQRARALAIGYWSVLLLAAAGLVAGPQLALSLSDALRIMLVGGIVIPAVTQFWLEHRDDSTD